MFGYGVPPINSKLSWFIWSAIEIISIIPKILINVYLPRALGFILIGERYVIDSLATMTCYFLRDPKFVNSWASDFLIKFIPPNTLVVLLDAEIEVIGKRRLARNSQYDEPIRRNPRAWYLGINPFGCLTSNHQRKVYLDLAKKAGAHIIDTSNLSVDKIHQIILKKIANYIEL
jgi:thymidylate kinase